MGELLHNPIHMKRFKASFWIPLFSLMTFNCFAQDVSQLGFHITQPKVWDITGSYVIRQDQDTTSITTVVSPKGVVTGTGREILESASAHAEGNMIIKGRLTGNSGVTKFLASMNGTATGTVQGRSFIAVSTSKLNGVISAETRQLMVESKSKVCASGAGCTTATQGFGLDLPEGMDGAWDCSLNITDLGNKVAGDAIVTVATGRTFSYSVKGSIKPKTGFRVLRLTGVGDAKGTALTLELQNDRLVKLNGSLLGQKLSFP